MGSYNKVNYGLFNSDSIQIYKSVLARASLQSIKRPATTLDCIPNRNCVYKRMAVAFYMR